MILAAVVGAIIVTMGLALVRAAKGPTVFDRILALNMFGTKTVLLIAVIGFVTGRPDFLDLGLVYALINFIGVIAVLRFSKYGHFADPDREKVS
ncbi:monovalent cation/H+ antiporter complex subunit F [Candidatus Palauibacter sp.]|uniref:monovalent cation/H+ antiporter complex subunit F n=1 Tax=Candidatus Palauibacter sp. TaxID=3101350 RepID=UPI003B5240CE